MSKPLNILIVEDNISFALELEMFLEELGHKLLGTLDNYDDALSAITEKQPDLILMDIHLRGKQDGTEIAEEINDLFIPIIFITSSKEKENYIAAKSANIFAYMVKPIQIFELERTIELVLLQKEEFLKGLSKDVLFLKKGDAYHKVAVQDVLFIKSEGNYCTLYLNNDHKFMNRVPLSSMESLFQSAEFLRPHRSYLVNVKAIDTIHFADSCLKIRQHSIPITRSTKAAFMEKYMLLK